MAKTLANLVVVTVHWGSEFLDWPNRNQREATKWLVDHGAHLIIGHHPHVVQSPEMIQGSPVFFSLGNHLFDQKYPATKEGMIADCQVSNGILQCETIATHAKQSSFFPQTEAGVEHRLHPVELGISIRVSGILLLPVTGGASETGEISLVGVSQGRLLRQTRPVRLAAITRARLDGHHEYLLALEWHYSSIDSEVGLRPYVCRVTREGLVAQWRGSALAWPLLDAIVLPDNETILCALHRGDSFINLQLTMKEARVAAYRWNGFRFSGVDDPKLTLECRKCWGIEDADQAGIRLRPFAE